MTQESFTFNSEAKYKVGGLYTKDIKDDIYRHHKEPLNTLSFQQDSRIVIKSTGESFEVSFPSSLFEGYKLPHVTKDDVVERWLHGSHMPFFQNQVNFAVWCATSGCGVSTGDHLASTEPLVRAVFFFHVYYQIRLMLHEMGCPLPADGEAHDPFNNPYDRRAYERLCAEFQVDPNTDWRQKVTKHNKGLGTIYHTDAYGYGSHHPVEPLHEWNPNVMTLEKDKKGFAGVGPLTVYMDGSKEWKGIVDYVAQGPEADTAWASFILDKSQGFTRAGVPRINDSIRTYVWAILGAQAMTRTGILGTGMAFDAQKQFLSNVEDSINRPMEISGAIKRYQDVLRYARSQVDFVFGFGLYMAPSDMELQVGTIAGYNNEILIASTDQHLGINNDLNVSPVPTAGTREKGIIAPPPVTTVLVGNTTVLTAHEGVISAAHNDEKTALIVGGITAGLLALWLLTR